MKIFFRWIVLISVLFIAQAVNVSAAEDITKITNPLKSWQIKLSQVVNESSVEDAVYLTDGNGNSVDITIATKQNSITVTPTSAYTVDEVYVLHILKSLASVSEATIQKDTHFEFMLLGENQVNDYILAPGQSVNIKNPYEETYEIYFEHEGAFDYASYNSLYINAEIIKGPSNYKTRELLRTGDAVVTNHSDQAMKILSPNRALSMTPTSEPALRRKTLAKGETVKVTKNTPTSIKMDFDDYDYSSKYGSFNYVQYGQSGAPEDFRYEVNYSDIHIATDGEIVVTNNGEKIDIYMPFRYTEVQANDEPALQIYELLPGKTVSVQMDLDVTSSNSVKVFGEPEIASITYYQIDSEEVLRTGDVNFMEKMDQGELIRTGYSWFNSKATQTETVIENTGDEVAKIVAPYLHFKLKEIDEPVFEQTVVLPGETAIIGAKNFEEVADYKIDAKYTKAFVTSFENDTEDPYPNELSVGDYYIGAIRNTIHPTSGFKKIGTKHVKNTGNAPLTIYSSYRTGKVTK